MTPHTIAQNPPVHAELFNEYKTRHVSNVSESVTVRRFDVPVDLMLAMNILHSTSNLTHNSPNLQT